MVRSLHVRHIRALFISESRSVAGVLYQFKTRNTTTGYRFVMRVVKKEAFGQRMIRNIKMSDAKLWFIKLYTEILLPVKRQVW